MPFRPAVVPSQAARRARARVGRTAVLGAAAAVMAVVLTACGTGQNWVEEGLDASGNGIYTTVGSVQAQNLTLVQGPEGSSSLALIGNFLNQGTTPDALVSATISPTGASRPSAAVITDKQVELVPGTLTNVGYNAKSDVSFFNSTVPTSSYVPLTLTFKDAGTTTVSVLVVPAAGIYEGIRPGPQPR